MFAAKGKGSWWGLGLVGMLLLSEAGVAVPKPMRETLVQEVETVSSEEIRAAAERSDLRGMATISARDG